MKTIRIKDFFKFGKLGDVQVGMLKEDVEDLLGYTDIFQHHENDFMTLTYGESQFIFEDEVLVCIHIEPLKTCNINGRHCICLGNHIELSNEVFEMGNNQSFKYVREALISNKIDFSEKFSENGTKLIKLSSGVTLDFSFDDSDNDKVTYESAQLISMSHFACC